MGPGDWKPPDVPGSEPDLPWPEHASRDDDDGPASAPAPAWRRWMLLGVAAVLLVTIVVLAVKTLTQIGNGPRRGGSGSAQASAGPGLAHLSHPGLELALPGASVALPKHWAQLRIPAAAHTVGAAPSLTPPCPNTVFGGQPACQDGLALAAVPGNDPRQALETQSRIRFNAMHAYIRAVAVLQRRAARFGGCLAYMTEWHVTWAKSPSTVEERIVLRTGVSYAGSRLESVFIRFADTAAAPPQPLIKATTSTIRCKA
jgi:hypothetical protein